MPRLGDTHDEECHGENRTSGCECVELSRDPEKDIALGHVYGSKGFLRLAETVMDGEENHAGPSDAEDLIRTDQCLSGEFEYDCETLTVAAAQAASSQPSGPLI